jgi:hypothetical protein
MYPSPDEYRAKTGRGLEIQTDKEKYKIVPCTYAGCDMDLIVNTFYAPAKGKCSAHNGKGSATKIESSKLVHAATDAKPNGALAQLLCPICGMPMLVRSITEDGGFITFVCSEGTASTIAEANDGRTVRCGTSVQVRPNWKWAEARSIPSRFRTVIESFNLDQKMTYFELKEARDG